MPISPEIGCVQGLLWRYTHPQLAQIDLDIIGQALVRQGFQDLTEQLWMRVYRHPEAHRILLVPRTGRVQLRLDYALTQLQRPVTAYLLSQQLDAIIDAACTVAA